MSLLPAGYARVLADRRVRSLLVGYAASLLGDGMAVVAVAALALDIGAGPHRSVVVGASVAAYSLPAVLGAVLLRRRLVGRPSRSLALLDCAVRVPALAAVVLVRALGLLTPPVYVALLAVASLLLAWGFAGRYAMLAEITAPEDRLTANALMTSLDALSLVVGPAVAGAVIAVADPSVLIAADAVGYTVLALCLRRVPTTAPRQSAGTGTGSGDEPVAESGWAFLRRHEQLLTLLLLTLVFYFLYGPVEVALPVFVAGHHTPAVLGAYWTAFGIGCLVGALAAGALRRLPLWTTCLVVIASWGGSLVVFGLTPALWPTLVAIGVGGAVYGPYPALSYTLFQNETPSAQLTSVLSARSAVLVAATPTGTVIGGPLVAALGARGTLLASGLATVALAVLASPLARRDAAQPR